MGCSSSKSAPLATTKDTDLMITVETKQEVVVKVQEQKKLSVVNADIAQYEEDEEDRKASVDTDIFVTIEEALVYVQQELGVDEEKAQAVVETIQEKCTNGVSSLELVIINARVKEVKETLEPKFLEYDPERTGFVTPSDAIAIMSQEFPGLPTTTVEAMVQRYDKDANGMVDFGEFVLFYSCVKAKKEQLEERFDDLDKDHSGDLQTDELRDLLMKEAGLTEEQAQQLIDDFDVDNDGTIDRTEFNHMWTKLFD